MIQSFFKQMKDKEKQFRNNLNNLLVFFLHISHNFQEREAKFRSRFPRIPYEKIFDTFNKAVFKDKLYNNSFDHPVRLGPDTEHKLKLASKKATPEQASLRSYGVGKASSGGSSNFYLSKGVSLNDFPADNSSERRYEFPSSVEMEDPKYYRRPWNVNTKLESRFDEEEPSPIPTFTKIYETGPIRNKKKFLIQPDPFPNKNHVIRLHTSPGRKATTPMRINQRKEPIENNPPRRNSRTAPRAVSRQAQSPTTTTTANSRPATRNVSTRERARNPNVLKPEPIPPRHTTENHDINATKSTVSGTTPSPERVKPRPSSVQSRPVRNFNTTTEIIKHKQAPPPKQNHPTKIANGENPAPRGTPTKRVVPIKESREPSEVSMASNNKSSNSNKKTGEVPKQSEPIREDIYEDPSEEFNGYDKIPPTDDPLRKPFKFQKNALDEIKEDITPPESTPETTLGRVPKKIEGKKSTGVMRKQVTPKKTNTTQNNKTTDHTDSYEKTLTSPLMASGEKFTNFNETPGQDSEQGINTMNNEETNFPVNFQPNTDVKVPPNKDGFHECTSLTRISQINDDISSMSKHASGLISRGDDKSSPRTSTHTSNLRTSQDFKERLDSDQASSPNFLANNNSGVNDFGFNSSPNSNIVTPKQRSQGDLEPERGNTPGPRGYDIDSQEVISERDEKAEGSIQESRDFGAKDKQKSEENEEMDQEYADDYEELEEEDAYSNRLKHKASAKKTPEKESSQAKTKSPREEKFEEFEYEPEHFNQYAVKRPETRGQSRSRMQTDRTKNSKEERFGEFEYEHDDHEDLLTHLPPKFGHEEQTTQDIGKAPWDDIDDEDEEEEYQYHDDHISEAKNEEDSEEMFEKIDTSPNAGNEKPTINRDASKKRYDGEHELEKEASEPRFTNIADIKSSPSQKGMTQEPSEENYGDDFEDEEEEKPKNNVNTKNDVETTDSKKNIEQPSMRNNKSERNHVMRGTFNPGQFNDELDDLDDL